MKVRKADLGALDEIASGGFGRVYKARLRGEPDELAYKEFTTDHARQAQSARAVVGLWDRLDANERIDLARYAAWPCALVHDHGRVCGLLMPLIPEEFFARLPNQATGQFKNLPRDMQWLIAKEAQRTAAGVDVPDIDRVDRHVLVAKLMYVFGRLHRLGWVYGDLSFKNVAFALDPPRIKLLDCDGAAPVGDPNRDQAHSPFWEPPECKSGQQRLQDTVTDVYKLGLAIVRCLTPGPGAASTTDPARLYGEKLDQSTLDSVARALASDRSKRPTAKELYVAFERLLQGRIASPVIRLAQLLTPIRLRGQDVTVEWDVEGAEEIVVEAANGQRVSVDTRTSPNGVSFRPDASGPVAVEARNRFGQARADVGEITLYELPRFDIGDVRLPRPVVPSLQPVVLQSAAAVVGERPVANVGTPVTAVPSPDLVAVIGGVRPAGRRLPALPRLDEPVGEAAGIIRSSVMNGSVELASVIGDAVADASARLTNEPPA